MRIFPFGRFSIAGVLLFAAGLVLFQPATEFESSRAAPATFDKPAVAPPGPSTLPFEVGEKLSFDVSWKIFDAGTATMTLTDRVLVENEEMYKVNAVVRSTGVVSTLFKVVDVFESFFHTKDLCSYRIMKDIWEGRRHRSTLVTFDQRTRKAQMEDRDLAKPESPVKRVESPIPGCVQDVISALYMIRTKPLKVDDQIHFPVSDGGRTYDVIVEIQAREEIRTPAGVFQTLRLEPRVFGGLFKSRGRLFVWVTNDSAKMPVQVKARMNIGTITASLTQVSKIPLSH
ncbi:MAG: DUF3108 domain-containing protein [Terriglobia bacterium]